MVLLARDMGSMPGTMGLGAGSFVAVWLLMMAAMMLPAVAPFASLYSRTFTDGRGSQLGTFASGYLIVWTLAALPAYGLAWLAGRLAVGHPAAATVLVAIFAACGAYQLIPVKDRCLARCRSPLAFLLKLGAYRGRTRDLRAGLRARPGFSTAVAALFRAPLWDLLGSRRYCIYSVTHPEAAGVFVPAGRGDRWTYGVVSESGQVSLADFSHDRVTRLIRPGGACRACSRRSNESAPSPSPRSSPTISAAVTRSSSATRRTG